MTSSLLSDLEQHVFDSSTLEFLFLLHVATFVIESATFLELEHTHQLLEQAFPGTHNKLVSLQSSWNSRLQRCMWNHGRPMQQSMGINVPNWIVDVSTLLHMLCYDTPNRRWIWSTVGSRWPSSTSWSHWWSGSTKWGGWEYVEGLECIEGWDHPTGNFLQEHTRLSAGLLARFLQDLFENHARFIAIFSDISCKNSCKIYPGSCVVLFILLILQDYAVMQDFCWFL